MQTKQQFPNPGRIFASLMTYCSFGYILLPFTILGVNDSKSPAFKEK